MMDEKKLRMLLKECEVLSKQLHDSWLLESLQLYFHFLQNSSLEMPFRKFNYSIDLVRIISVPRIRIGFPCTRDDCYVAAHSSAGHSGHRHGLQ
jgi:hypothetical protein